MPDAAHEKCWYWPVSAPAPMPCWAVQEAKGKKLRILRPHEDAELSEKDTLRWFGLKAAVRLTRTRHCDDLGWWFGDTVAAKTAADCYRAKLNSVRYDQQCVLAEYQDLKQDEQTLMKALAALEEA